MKGASLKRALRICGSWLLVCLLFLIWTITAALSWLLGGAGDGLRWVASWALTNIEKLREEA